MLIVPKNSRMTRVTVTTIAMIVMMMTLRIPTKKKRRRMVMKRMNHIYFVLSDYEIMMILVFF